MSKNILSLILVVLLLAFAFLYLFMNRFERTVVGTDRIPVLIEINRWSGEIRLRTLYSESSKSFQEGSWVEVR